MNRRKVLQLLALAPLAAVNVTANTDVDLIQRFQSTYRACKSLSCTFSDGKGLGGSLVAQRGGRYRITLPDRVIVSNGVTVWSATPSARTVILNKYRATSNEVSLERVFFEIMSIYRGSVVSQGTNGSAVIRLVAPATNAVIAGVSSVDVTLNKAMNVTELNLTASGSTQRFVIRSLKRNPALKDSQFTYQSPKDWEVIDLR